MPRQLRAFDAPRTRKRLLVPQGAGCWWGVDPSTVRVAIACITPELERSSRIVSLPTLEGAERLEAIREGTRVLADGIYARGHRPGVIVVEEPAGFGKRPNPSLAYAVGACLCGLAGAGRVEFVASAKWKLEACGYGAIAKPKPSSKEPYAVLEWARDVGYEGSSWDEADAWAIAEYARLAYELDER